MAKVKQFDKATCREVGDAIEQALKSVAVKYGINIRKGNGRFSPDTLDLKIHCARVQGGKVLSKEASDFKRLASLYGLKPSDLGRTFTAGNGTYKITGLNTKAHKYPINATKVTTGAGFKFPEKRVKLLLDK